VSAYSDAVLALSPALYWRLGESAGSTAEDASPNNRDGTYAGVVLGRPSLVTGDADTAVDATGSGTVTSSYNPWNLAGVTTVGVLATRTGGSTIENLWATTTLHEFALQDRGTSGDHMSLEGYFTWSGALSGIAQGERFHCVLVINFAADSAELFINGVSKGVGTGVTATPSGNFRLFGDSFGNAKWSGDADELFIVGGAVSASDIANLASLALNGPPNPAVVNELPRHQTELRVLLGSEDVTRYVADGLTWSAADPGGFEASSFSFPRRVKVEKGLPVRIEAGLASLFEGRVTEPGEALVSGQTRVACEGAGAVLRDGRMAEIYRHARLADWRGASVQRRINNVSSGFASQDASAQPDVTTGEPSLAEEVQGAWAAGGLPSCQGWFDAGETARIASLYYAWKKNSAINSADASWTWRAQLSDDDILGATDSTANLRAAGPDSGTLVATSTSRRFALAELFYSAAGGAEGTTYGLYWTALALYGTHGLTLRGTEPDAGFYTSDIAWDAVSRVTGVDRGVVEDATGLVVPHASYRDPVAHERIAADMALLAGWHWGVWESLSLLGGNPRFDFRSYPGSPTASTTRGRCDELDLSERLADLYDTVNVTWQDTAGTQHITTRTRAVADLDDSRTLDIDMGLADTASAAAFGDFVLLLSQMNARATGSAVMRGNVLTPSGPMPAMLLRPGLDRLGIPDLPDLPLFGGSRREFIVKRVESTASREGVSTTAELGTGANLIETLQARIELATALAGG
jgi:hypothetical protein